jgi:hypothetical protein
MHRPVMTGKASITWRGARGIVRGTRGGAGRRTRGRISKAGEELLQRNSKVRTEWEGRLGVQIW